MTTGNGSAPALYNDEAIIQTMLKAGYTLADARNYVAIRCVEPTSQGKTLGSTDAAILNLPLALELALNEGRQFGFRKRIGAKTPPVSRMPAMADVTTAYKIQLRHQLNKQLTKRERTILPLERVVNEVNATVKGWVGYFHYRNCSQPLNRIRNHLEQRLITHLRKRHKVRNRKTGYVRFPNRSLYEKYGLYKVPTTADWTKAHVLR